MRVAFMVKVYLDCNYSDEPRKLHLIMEISIMYIPIEVKSDNFATVVNAISIINFADLNLTKPFSEKLIYMYFRRRRKFE